MMNRLQRTRPFPAIFGAALCLAMLSTACAAPPPTQQGAEPDATGAVDTAVTDAYTTVVQTPLAGTDVPVGGAGPATAPAPAPEVQLKLLDVEPVTGVAGDAFSITGQDLPANKTVEFVWLTHEGSYTTVVGPENVEFHEKTFADSEMPLAEGTTDAEGRVSVKAQVPDDYGELHDLVARVDGVDTAKAGFRIMRTVTVEPKEGPLGTPIMITISGLGWKAYESTAGIRYDNSPVGIVTAVTTRGTARFKIRAAGGAGRHVIDVGHAGKSVPYLNNQQSGTASIVDTRFWFTVTEDAGPPPNTLDWPSDDAVSDLASAAPRTAGGAETADTGISATVGPSHGPILTEATVTAEGLDGGKPVSILWVTARGNRVNPSGWSLTDTPMSDVVADASGHLSATVQIPDDLGGWHVIKLVQGTNTVAEVPFNVERGLVDVTPRVKAGEEFTIHLKGIGWTELDNGVAVDYDNTFIGFACGFNSNGDVTMNLVATGQPGTHLIDLYPMIYQGHGEPPWGYQVPILTYATDFPGLGLGYRLPAFRLAIEVTE